jgi:hypothetical protein
MRKFRERVMPKKLICALLVTSMLGVRSAYAKASPVSTDQSGAVVIVFKDGHRQSIPASSITAMEFKSAAGVVTPISIPALATPGKGVFAGKWVVGQGSNTSNTFYITLEENGVARKSMGESHGTWVYVNGEAQVSWDDGWHDAIRRVGDKYEKFAYGPGNSFTSPPDNVTEARNTSPKPI